MYTDKVFCHVLDFSVTSLPNCIVFAVFSPCGPCDGLVLKDFFQRDAEEEGRLLPSKAELNK